MLQLMACHGVVLEIIHGTQVSHSSVTEEDYVVFTLCEK
jgi:hypothetical protein